MTTTTRYKKRILSITVIGALLTAVCFASAPAIAFDTVNQTFFGVAIKGYDPVAYFLDNRAVKGSRQFSHVWNDAKWYFASADHRDLFAADPQAYAPQYGGY